MALRLEKLFSLSGLLFFSSMVLASADRNQLILPFGLPAGSTTFVNDSGISGSVASVTVKFNSNGSCSSYMGQKTVSSGPAVSFLVSSTIGILPDSMYLAATNLQLNPLNIGSVSIEMQDPSGTIFYAAEPGTLPCAQIQCSNSDLMCTYSGAPINITSYSPPS